MEPENLRRPSSLDISSAIAQQSMRWVTPAAKNPEKVMSVELVEVRSTFWKTVSSRNKVGPNDLVGILRRRLPVRLLPLVTASTLTRFYG